MPTLTLSQLETFLEDACNLLREGGSDSSDFKYYIFGMLFVKRVNDQFEAMRQEKRKALIRDGLSGDDVAELLDDKDSYSGGFFVPISGRWEWKEKGEDGVERYRGLAHAKEGENLAVLLDAALDAIEKENTKVTQGALKTIRFVTQAQSRQLEDKVLVDLIHHFNGKRLRNEDFEFPDLMGAAYEYLLKYFADDAGKKGGEFFTPPWVVRLLVRILDPKPGMAVYDPTAGSGGMLIQSYQHVERQTRRGDRVNLTLAGQELAGGHWATCKLNMILHGVLDADVLHGDTILTPLHVEDNRLRRFDRVIANPPFAQNYSPGKEGLKLRKERFPILMPQTGKKADLMFVQHMVASLKRRANGDDADGRLAVVMPHGVLFRGGKEKEARQHFLSDGVLEAVIGLPPNLFYGTGIPACVLVMSYEGAAQRKGDDGKVLFVNADREYREGKAQNFLRPEDIEKIVHVWAKKVEEAGYARLVPVSELRHAEYNLNIRRFVDNAPPPEPHDVRAHLHGGIPVAEIDSLARWLTQYSGMKGRLFAVPAAGGYAKASDNSAPGGLAEAIATSPGLRGCHDRLLDSFDGWWDDESGRVEGLPETHDVFGLESELLRTLPTALASHTLLTGHQVRGALARFFVEHEPELKTLAASGWVATLIPADEILKSQFAELVREAEERGARIAELQGLFAAAKERDVEEGDGDGEEDELGVLSSKQAKTLRDELKEAKGELGTIVKEAKARVTDLFNLVRTAGLLDAKAKKGDFTKGLTAGDPDFTNALAIADRLSEHPQAQARVTELREFVSRGDSLVERVTELDDALAAHKGLEAELKHLRAEVREVERRQNEVVAAAREKIAPADVKRIVLDLLRRELRQVFEGYLRYEQRTFTSAVVALITKYATPLGMIESERGAGVTKLRQLLSRIGYDA